MAEPLQEEDKRTVACKTAPFPILKAAFNLVLGILEIFVSKPLDKL
jgi:hypothetical protein